MAGASIEIEWDDAQLKAVFAVFDRLQKEIDDLTPLMQDIGEYLLPAHQDRILAGIQPDGQPFEPLDPDYAAWKIDKGKRGAGKILILDNVLRGLLAYQADSESLRLGTNTPYGATHQFGRGAIPARPYLGFAAEDITEIEAIALDFLEDVISG